MQIDKHPDENGAARVHFEEGACAGDGKFLDPFIECSVLWLRTLGEGKPVVLKTKEGLLLKSFGCGI